MALDNKPIPKGDKEELVEQERESDAQFETTSGTLERILVEAELTNELLGGKKGKKGGGIGYQGKVKKVQKMMTKMVLPY